MPAVLRGSRMKDDDFCEEYIEKLRLKESPGYRALGYLIKRRS